MEMKLIPVGPFAANCVVLWSSAMDCAQTGEWPCWIVDPGADAEDVIAFCEERKLRPALIALTHGHFDHIGGITGLLAKWPEVPVHLSPADAAWAFLPMNAWGADYPATARPKTLVADLVEGARLAAGGLEAQVLATPGHTPGGVCLHFVAEGLLLSGDTLFAGSCGRTDFPGGNGTALTASLDRLATLPPATRVVPGHGGTTTIGREVESNPFMQP
ncbi:MAG: MBL fold metallo-hydrolase [Kiritimatiellia bacterium]